MHWKYRLCPAVAGGPWIVTARAVVVGTAAAILLATAGSARGEVRIAGVRVDGREVSVTPAADAADPAVAQVPAGAARVDVIVEGEADDLVAAEASSTASGLSVLRGTRLRYRLDGRDEDWQDAPAFGRLQLSFSDANRNGVGSEQATMPGTSPRWRGGPERSPLTRYSISCVAPPLADRLRVNFLSGDGDLPVGELGIDDVRITITSVTGEQRVHALRLEGLDQHPHPLATPRGWGRSGTRDQMSRVVLREETGRPMLVIVDDAPDAYGSWIHSEGVPVGPGERVEVAWQACHAFGRGGFVNALYGQLPAGTYWLRAAAFLPGGQPTASETSLRIVVERPWYARPEAWIAAVASGLVLAAFAARGISVRKMRHRLEEVQRAHALDQERARIARDLHDDIGAGLTEIAMQTDWVRRDVEGLAPPETVARAERACTSAVELVRSVDAIVWAVNPANDTLDRFSPYLTHAAEQFLDAAGLAVRFDLPEQVPSLPLAGTVRHALFLVVREAINNVVKHAGASLVRLGLRIDEAPRRLVITVDDDGCGLPTHVAVPSGSSGAAVSPGTLRSGLGNMRRRIEELGGSFMIVSRPEGGTRIECAVPLAGG